MLEFHIELMVSKTWYWKD